MRSRYPKINWSSFCLRNTATHIDNGKLGPPPPSRIRRLLARYSIVAGLFARYYE